MDDRVADLVARPDVDQVDSHPVEIQLAAGASNQDLLKALVGRVAVRRFEVASPSLHKIFVQLVGRGHREAVSNE